uniref:Tyrosine-protein kinase BAZ1B n=1 Tax=Phallusia mammillata TaxID=59560 RepID=A0A6F9D7Z4_9ASCI|nr:tyrosine-protein kinase BAZ1B [Phallusia mammillata]
MPLNGKLLLDTTIESSSPTEENQKPFVIPHTKEVFYSEKEYQNRADLYEKRCWTCQCTGRHNLTHKEAILSEKSCRDRLAESYAEVWEEPVLKLVQHSFAPLDSIIQQAYNMFQTKLMPGEKVLFSPKSNKTYGATIVESFSDSSTTNGESDFDSSNQESPTSTSPSSDKENKGRQALITDMFKSDNRRSPRAATASKNFPIKGKRLTLLPLQYAISLTDENKIVNGVPCEYLARTQKPPNRELIRIFIRSSAVRPDGRWIVDENMAFRYSLKPLISPEEEASMIERATGPTLGFLREILDAERKASWKKSLLNGVKNSDPEANGGENALASIFQGDKTQKRKRDSSAPGSAKRTKQDKRVKKKLSKGLDSFLMKSPSAMNGVTENGVDSDGDVVNLLNTSTNSVTERQSGSSRKNSSPRKKKQATLLELTKKGGIKLLASRTPTTKQRGTPSKTPRRTQQPIIVRQMLALKKEKVFRSHKYKIMTTSACKILTKKQLLNLPPEVKDDIIKKWEQLEFQKRLKAMTPEERRRWMKDQRTKKEGKFEDQHLVRVGRMGTLPHYEPVQLPENLPNTLFGDIAMICEFLYSYHSLLTPKDPYYHKQFTIHTLGEALTNGKQGFSVTSRILVVLLQTLLADDIAKDYMELDYKLNKVHVTPDVCCELTRICLRQVDEELDDDADNNTAQNVDNALNPTTAQRLFELEIYDMEPSEQLEIMGTLVYRLINTYAVQIHIEDALQKAANAFQKAKQHRKEKKVPDKEKDSNKEATDSRPPSDKEEEEDESSPINSSNEAIDLISRVKNRRMLSEKNRKEEIKRKKQQDEERMRLMEEQRIIHEEQRATKVLTESRATAQTVRRRVCLGTDRNHNRYWLFHDGVPGLYIETGWVNDDIDYTTMPEVETEPTSPVKSPVKKLVVQDSPVKAISVPSQSSDEDDVPLSQLNTPSKKKPRFRKSKQEATWPRPGQNMWMELNSVEELEKLTKTLMWQGVRESKLKQALKNNYDAIVRSLNKKRNLQQNDAPTRRSTLPSNGDELHLTLLRKHFTTMVNDATRGGLSTLPEPDVIQQRISIAETAAEFSTILLEIHSSIAPKFLKQYMTGISDKKRLNLTECSSEREKGKAERRVIRWRQAVEDASLLSRVSLLFTILNNSIQWDMYHYKRQNARRAAAKNRNYSDMNDGAVDEENDGEDESDEEQENSGDAGNSEDYDDEDGGQRRSSRIQARSGRSRKREEVEEVISRPRTRQKKRSYIFQDSDSDEEEEENEQEEEEEGSENEMESNESGEEEEQEEEGSDEEEGSEDEEPNSSICRSIVEKIMKYQYSEFFRDPVNENDVPDYYEVIANPICLNDIIQRIDESNDNDVIEQMMEDVRLLLDNALEYNGAESFVAKEGERMKQSFVKYCRERICSPVHHRRLKRLFSS